MNINIIVAISKNNVIGYKNQLPWHLPKDLMHFKNTTLDKIVVMGKNTFLSILEYLHKPLPNRKNIVISSTLAKDINMKNSFPQVDFFSSLQEFYANYQNNQQEIYIIGGEQIYAQTINLADKLIISHVDIECLGDAFFPTIEPDIWQITEQTNINDIIQFTITTYKHKN